ncbi:MAG TPA: IS1634 family transposase [Methanosarcinales archaeon]|nr:IS1634 family transposase [Methanosarcinales archaeon]
MVFLEKKKKKGHIYWYATERKMVNGVVKRTWQEYLGTAEKIVEMKKKSEGMPHIRLKSFQYGKTAALLAVSDELNFVETVNNHTDKKKIEGLTVGDYLLLNIIGRCDGALSENAMQKWFEKSTLGILWKFPHKLSCQNFLNHYQYVDQETSRKIEDDLCAAMIEMGITPHLLFLDESNWFTYIEKGEELPQKGKSKQFRYDKNLISVGLAVSEDNVPFMHETYEGNTHDSKIFPRLLDTLTERLTNLKITTENLILVFDKGNNSEVNIEEVISEMHILASAKHEQARDLLRIPLDKYKYLYTNPKSHKIYGYRTKYEFFGRQFTTVVMYNDASYKKQVMSYEKRKSKMLEKLADLKRRLESNRGKERDKSSVEREVNGIIQKDFIAIIGYKVGEVPEGKKKPAFTYWIKDAEKERYDGFGKTVIFTDKDRWHSEKIVKTYNQKSLVEDDFKLLNDAFLVTIGPINHHKDVNIRVHTFLCITGLLFYRYLAYRCKYFHISLKRLVGALEGIRIALAENRAKRGRLELVIEEMDSTQARLFSHLNLGKFITG